MGISLVEAVEALTIMLAVATVRGRRTAGLGALAGLASLAVIILGLSPLLDRVPLQIQAAILSEGAMNSGPTGSVIVSDRIRSISAKPAASICQPMTCSSGAS